MPAMNPSLLCDFANSRQIGPLVTFARASTAWRTNRLGLLELVPSGAPAFEHHPTTLACLGLAIWESRTNLAIYSRDLTNAAWVTTAGTGTETKDATGADGVASAATRITATSANYTLIQSITSASASRATTCYVRRITGTGTVEFTANGGATWTALTVTSVWTRVSAPVATITDPQVGFRLATSGDEIAVDFVQCESGAFSTSPIDTAASQVTRAADTAAILGTSFSSWYRADRGTLVCDYIQTQQAQTQFAATISDGTTTNYLGVRAGFSTGASTTFAVLATSTQAAPSAVNVVLGGRNRFAAAFAADDFSAAGNGTLGTPDLSGSLPPGMNQLRLGARGDGGSERLNGYLPKVAFYPDRLSNADLLALSAS